MVGYKTSVSMNGANMVEPQFVLILDDDDGVRVSLQYYFEDCGWQVLTAETAEEALELLKTSSPDCAVVDIRLPGMDGNEFVRRAHKIHPSLVYILCSGSPEYLPPEDISALSQVADTVFAKPIRKLAGLKDVLITLVSSFHGNG